MFLSTIFWNVGIMVFFLMETENLNENTNLYLKRTTGLKGTIRNIRNPPPPAGDESTKTVALGERNPLKYIFFKLIWYMGLKNIQGFF